MSDPSIESQFRNPCDADWDLTIKDKDGKTAIARENDNEGVIKLLQAHRAPE